MTYSVDTAELPGSPAEQWNEDGSFTATVMRECPWDQRNSLALEIYNELYPRIPATLARARVVSIQPHPEGSELLEAPGHSQHAVYEKAKLTITYKTQGPQQDAIGDWFRETIEPTCEFITLPSADFTWKSTGEKLNENESPGMQIRGLDYKLTRYHLTLVPAAVKALVGCCNSGTITCRRLGLQFLPEELLYHPPVVEDVAKSDGSYDLTLSMRFSFRRGGWNCFWNRAAQTWDRLQYKGADYSQYPLGDISVLLR